MRSRNALRTPEGIAGMMTMTTMMMSLRAVLHVEDRTRDAVTLVHCSTIKEVTTAIDASGDFVDIIDSMTLV